MVGGVNIISDHRVAPFSKPSLSSAVFIAGFHLISMPNRFIVFVRRTKGWCTDNFVVFNFFPLQRGIVVFENKWVSSASVVKCQNMQFRALVLFFGKVFASNCLLHSNLGAFSNDLGENFAGYLLRIFLCSLLVCLYDLFLFRNEWQIGLAVGKHFSIVPGLSASRFLFW